MDVTQIKFTETRPWSIVVVCGTGQDRNGLCGWRLDRWLDLVGWPARGRVGAIRIWEI